MLMKTFVGEHCWQFYIKFNLKSEEHWILFKFELKLGHGVLIGIANFYCEMPITRAPNSWYSSLPHVPRQPFNFNNIRYLIRELF